MATKKSDDLLSAEEKEAMKALVKERKAAKKGADGEADLLAVIDGMTGPDKAMSARLHELIKAAAPGLSPKTWYGMPAYANKDGKAVLFFRHSTKFKERYLTLGFNQEATLDDGHMWPIVFAVTKLTAAEEARITELVKKAVG